MSSTDARPLAVVTGAGGGIGAAIAALADERGYAVAVLDLDGDRAAQVATGLRDARSFGVDVSDEPGVDAVLDDLGALPAVVVSNAGIVRFGPLLDLSLQDWRAVVDVNLTGTFVVCRAAARRMVASGTGGSIVAITSMNGVVPGPSSGAYTSTKAGAAMLVGQMAIEWGGHGIRVNAVAPGLIDGGMSGPIYADPEFRTARESRVPIGRLGTEDDVARAVMFLAGEDAAYITGQTLLVDGGVTHNMIGQLPRPPAVDRGEDRL